MSSERPKTKHHISILKQFLPWGDVSYPHKREMKFPLLSVGMCTFLINIFSLALPIALIQIYDRIIPNKSYESLVALTALVFVSLIMEIFLKLIRSYILEWSGAVFEHKTYCAAMNHLSKANSLAIEKVGLGTILAYLDKINKLKEFYSYQPVFLILIDLPFMVLYLFLIWYLGGWLVLPPIIIVGFFLLNIWKDTEDMAHPTHEYYQYNKKRTSYIIETLKGIHTIKSFGAESFFLRRFDRLNHSIWNYSHQLSVKMGQIFNKTVALSQFITVTVSTTGAILFLYGKLPLGAFSACILLAYRLIYPMQRSITFLQKMNDIMYYQSSIDNLFNIPLIGEKSSVIENIKGEIELKNVTLQFENTNEPLFKDLVLHIKPNSCIAIKAELHSGQTTLLNLISGLIKPNLGDVLIDNVPSFNISREQFPKILSYITTNGEIFPGTIRDNLTFFDAYDSDKAEEMAQLLGINSITSYLPLGYETQLLDNPADPISPGMKQRISIARTLASDAKIILFDHADSTLDIDGILYLKDCIKSLKKDKTIILLSNDKEILKLADTVYQIKNKKIAPIKPSKKTEVES